MNRWTRWACELGVEVFLALALLTDSIPRFVGIPLLAVGFVLTGGRVALHLHDRHRHEEDEARSLDLR